jgi:hypothetical protein
MAATIYRTSPRLMRLLTEVANLESLEVKDLDVGTTVQKSVSYYNLFEEASNLYEKTHDPKLEKLSDKALQDYIVFMDQNFLRRNQLISPQEAKIFERWDLE